jgi:hypothetical protein
MARVEPYPWKNWKKWEEYAHSFGAGPVTVYVKTAPPNATKGTGAAGDFEDYQLQAAAEAVRRWNRATGVAVFQITDNPDSADIVVNIKPDASPVNEDGVPVLGNAGIRSFSGETPDASANVFQYGYADPDVYTHELGHTIGLDHPDTPRTRQDGTYSDPKLLMSGGGKPAPVEARRVAEGYGSNITPQYERQEANRRRSSTPEPRKKKAKPADPGGPGSGQQR